MANNDRDLVKRGLSALTSMGPRFLRRIPPRFLSVVWLGRCRLEQRFLDGIEVLTRQPLRGRVATQPVLLDAPVPCARSCIVEAKQLLAGEAVIAHVAHRALDARLVLGVLLARRVDLEAARLSLLDLNSGVRSDWTAQLLRRGSDKPLPGGEVTIVRVDKAVTLGRINVTSSCRIRVSSSASMSRQQRPRIRRRR